MGVNGFRPYLTKWDKHPDRDDAWAAEERAKIGDERFRREHECVIHATLLKLIGENGEFEQEIGELFETIDE
jgi:hypothetical protein